MDINEKKWKRMNHGPIEGSITDYVENIFGELINIGQDFEVCIGTDSQRKGKGYTFSTVIVIRAFENLGRDKKSGKDIMIGRGCKVIGTKFFSDKYPKNKEGVKERMMFEVANSIDIAYKLSPLLDKYNVPLAIHADINADVKWESNKALNEVVGYILGMGYDFKVKPDAWAASKSADKVSRN